MPINYGDYPENWLSDIRPRILKRSGGQCECMGECGLHKTHPGPRRCTELQGNKAKYAKGEIILTVAHLDHNKKNCADTNLRAMRQRCHLRYDAELHTKHAVQTMKARRG